MAAILVVPRAGLPLFTWPAASFMLGKMASILILTGDFTPVHSGITTYARGFADAAHAAGHKVCVYASLRAEHAGFDDRAAFPYQVIRFAHPGDWRMTRQFISATRAVVGKGKFDVVHASDTPFARALAILNLTQSIPYLATVHGDELLWCRGFKRRLWRWIGAYRTAQRVLCNSEYTRRLLVEGGFVPSSTAVDVTYCGVSDFWFADDPEFGPELGDVRAMLGIPADRKIILTVARLDVRKGHRLVIEALDQLSAAVRDRCVYVATGPDYDPEHAAALRRMGAAAKAPVVFTGPQPDRIVRALYRAASLFVLPNEPHPTRVEGFGQVFLEAGAQGIPSIASPLGGIPEAVHDGKTGLLVPTLDVPALARAIETLLTDEAQRTRLGEAARSWARKMSFARCMNLSYRLAAQPALDPP
jgi:phosphatidyl-myo-inositol dimannoside synthase